MKLLILRLNVGKVQKRSEQSSTLFDWQAQIEWAGYFVKCPAHSIDHDVMSEPFFRLPTNRATDQIAGIDQGGRATALEDRQFAIPPL